jgi:hypothetical protein
MEIARKIYYLSQLLRLTILKPKKNSFSAKIKKRVKTGTINLEKIKIPLDEFLILLDF